MIRASNLTDERQTHGNLRIVINIVGAVIVLTLLGIIVPAVREQPIPDVLTNLGIGALGLLGGLLVPQDPGA